MSKEQVQNPKTVAKRQAPRQVVYNDMDLSNWKQYDEILTDSLWVIPARERSAGHKLDYHGNCVPQILTQMLQRYTKRGDAMVDFFLGSGTSAIEAHRLERQCIGIEIQPSMTQYVQEKVDELGAAETTRIINADSSDKILAWNSVIFHFYIPLTPILFVFRATNGICPTAIPPKPFWKGFSGVPSWPMMS
jgi:hypothetical protein